jgi:hypothetical protein
LEVGTRVRELRRGSSAVRCGEVSVCE